MNYEINLDTLVLCPKDKHTIVYEEKKNFIIQNDILNIIKDSCVYYGSTYEGRRKGSSVIIGRNDKLPIIIEESNEIILFPTTSPRRKDCKWISFNNIVDYKKDKTGTKIMFNNGVNYHVDITYRIMNNQYLKCAKLNLILKNRKYLKN